jgi:ATP-binding cassette subfamily F protein 3
MNKINIKLRSSIISGNDVIFVEGVCKEYPGKSLFNDVSFNLKRGEKVFLLGPNGCGKSTLLKIIVGKLQANSGIVEFGHKVRIGYYDQEQENLDESKTILEEIIDSNPELSLTQIRTTLASFLFPGEDVLKQISVLSGGEKSRVSLVKLILSGANFLVLDEPTNHLDINSREVLEESLNSFDGTILAVSHDRYFINKLASRILDMEKDSLLDCNGNYSFFIDYKSRFKANREDDTGSKNVTQAKLEHLTNKNEKARIRRLEKQLQETEEMINKAEERLKTVELEMTKEDVISDHLKLSQLFEEQSELKDKIDTLYEQWESLTSERDTN